MLVKLLRIQAAGKEGDRVIEISNGKVKMNTFVLRISIVFRLSKDYWLHFLFLRYERLFPCGCDQSCHWLDRLEFYFWGWVDWSCLG